MIVTVSVRGKFSPEKIEQAVGSKLRSWFNDKGLRIEGLAKERTAVSTGRLQRSWTYRVEGSGTNLALLVGSNVKYASVYELGRRPGKKMPPSKALERWVKQRGMSPKMAFVIARAIGQRGTRGRYPLSSAIETVFGVRPKLGV